MGSVIYKYFRGDHYSLIGLRERTLWFSRPPYFNDPFDCSMEHLVTRESPLSEEGKEFIRQNTMKFGICCFSEDPISHQLWSFYANGYQGFCVEYDREVIQSFCSDRFQANCDLAQCTYEEFPVNLDDRITWERDGYYIREVPLRWILSCPKRTDRLFQMLLLQKNEKVWKSEREWRIILSGRAIKNGAYQFDSDGKGYNIPLPENAIKSIIIGSKMVDSEREKIEAINREVYSGQLEMKEIELNHDTWGLKLKS